MDALLTAENLSFPVIEDGDAGVILKADNKSFQVFTTGSIEGVDLSDGQRELAHKIVAISTLLRFPQLLDLCLDVAGNPDLVSRLLERRIAN